MKRQDRNIARIAQYPHVTDLTQIDDTEFSLKHACMSRLSPAYEMDTWEWREWETTTTNHSSDRSRAAEFVTFTPRAFALNAATHQNLKAHKTQK